MIIEPIGIIYTPYMEKAGCPIQPLYAPDAIGRVEVFEKYEAGLRDIETFSHIYLLYHFDRAGEMKLTRQTFLDDQFHGIFATRHPARPNGIGMSIVTLRERKKNILIVGGIDVLNMTPLLDIKPYIPRFDRIKAASAGWTRNKHWRPKPTGRE
jgi:tRNA-Thr(GGU) m(6)t(6)A37 methyltransferase TsaA